VRLLQTARHNRKSYCSVNSHTATTATDLYEVIPVIPNRS